MFPAGRAAAAGANGNRATWAGRNLRRAGRARAHAAHGHRDRRRPPATLLEIRWQGLRDLMRRTPAIRAARRAAVSREQPARSPARDAAAARTCPTDALERVAAATVFESYGNFDWYTDFGPHRRRDPAEQIAAEPLIAAEGDPPTGLLLDSLRLCPREPAARARASHARLSRQGAGVRARRDCRSAQDGSGSAAGGTRCGRWGMWTCCGFRRTSCCKSILPNCRLRIADCEMSRIAESQIDPQSAIRNPQSEIDDTPARFPRRSSVSQRHADDADQPGSLHAVRRLRAGLRGDARQQSAVHPPGAEARQPHGGQCLHALRRPGVHDRLPDRGDRPRRRYAARCGSTTARASAAARARIAARTRRFGWSRFASRPARFVVDEATQQPILKATKCDFCAGQLTGPACQNACPHDALVRVDMANLTSWPVGWDVDQALRIYEYADQFRIEQEERR